MASKKNSGTGRSALRLSDVARLGLTGLRARPMRAILSALGIAIGIAAMVGVVGVSASSQARLQEQLRALGTNMLTARSGTDLSGTELIPSPCAWQTAPWSPGAPTASWMILLDAVLRISWLWLARSPPGYRMNRMRGSRPRMTMFRPPGYSWTTKHARCVGGRSRTGTCTWRISMRCGRDGH